MVPCCAAEEVELECYLLDCKALESTNHKTVSDALLTVLQRFEIPSLKVSAFVTDNAPHMYKAWGTSLSTIWLKAVHVTCTAHLLNLINEIWMKCFGEVNKSVCAIKEASTA